MSRHRIALLTALAMLAFAGNSLLCRIALKETNVDPASFTLVRIASGALVLGLIVVARGEKIARVGKFGSWRSALALFAYAAGFSFAYVSLPTASGALLLFGAVQATMIGYGLWCGERLRPLQMGGLLVAFSGLFTLLLPGLAPASPGASIPCAPRECKIRPMLRPAISCARCRSRRRSASSCCRPPRCLGPARCMRSPPAP
jgi:drug/metabolite transporter (DMT)-like permease